MSIRHRGTTLLLLLLITLSACSPLKRLQPNEYFLNKNIIELEKEDSKRKMIGASPNSVIPTPYFSKEELNSILKQKSNRKILGFIRFHMGVYHLGVVGDTTVDTHKGLAKFWKKIKRGMRQIGEPPVVLDTALTEKSRKQLELYLERKGFFDATVTDTIIQQHSRKKKVNVIYTLHPGEPYKIRNITYASKDPDISNMLVELQPNTLLKEGTRYDEATLDQERDRITTFIRDNGMYFFNKNYITYRNDSALGTHQVDLNLYVNRQFENIDPSLTGGRKPENHHRYHYNRISIITNYEAKDSIADTTFYSGYYYVQHLKRDYIKKSTIARSLFITPGEQFLQSNVDITYGRLADLNVFRFINFRFKDVSLGYVPDTSTATESTTDSTITSHNYLLDLDIQLSPLDKHEYRIESEFTHSGGNLGIAGNISYQNKNWLRGAETFQLKVSGGLESLRNFADSTESKKLFFFNTYDLGPELNIGFKKALLIDSWYPKRYITRTNFSLGFNYQSRPDYKRTLSRFSFGYDIKVSSNFRYQVYPTEINSVNVTLTPAFEERLISTGDPNLVYAYRNHLISDMRASLIWTNQTLRKSRNFYYFRLNAEFAGYVPKLLWASILKFDRDTNGRYIVLGNPFSQYIKPDADFVYHFILNQSNSIVCRTASGIGITTGNSKGQLMPFDKAFYAGGANDIRAWQARTLGPGSYKQTSIFETGDFKLEANVEFRSSVFKFLETALFLDGGNIWILNDTSNALPGAQIRNKNISDIFHDCALGAGIGLRFNFTFFIFRTDFAVKLHDPSLEGDRWIYKNNKFVLFRDIVPNLAIGYPF